MADARQQAVLDPEREHCAPKWKKPFIHGGFGWKGHPRGYLFADFMDFLAGGTAEEEN